MAGRIFISHSTHDDDLVASLRGVLEELGFSAWTDSRELTAGYQLETEIVEAVRGASHLLAVLSPHAFNSSWMRKEIALGVELEREREDFKVVPLLIPPMESGSLVSFFDDPPVALTFDPKNDRLDDLRAKLRATFGGVTVGGAKPDDPETITQPAAAPLAELVADFEDLSIEEDDGVRRAVARVKLRWRATGHKTVESKRFKVRSPLGPIEAGELAWYLERYAIWPGEVFRPRAQAVEDALVEWGRRLFEILQSESTAAVWNAFRRPTEGMERCVSIRVDPASMEGASEEDTNTALEAATLWLALPWELLHDGQGVLATGARGTRVRRQLPGREEVAPLVTATPIRVLVVSPRPEDETTSYIDHRISSKPLIEAFLRLGERAEVEILGECTLAGMSRALREADEAGRAFHAVHFDGHGVYHRKTGLGALCFEDSEDLRKLKDRAVDLVSAEQLAQVLRQHRVALMVLEACQSAKSDEDPMASVAGRLLESGVASVVAMSHLVLVATAARFVETFYDKLSTGSTVGKAVLEAQTRLREDPTRGRALGKKLRMLDWFVPVLFQEQQDPQLVFEVPGRRTGEEILRQVDASIAGLPEEPSHGFTGRSRELLAVERLLQREDYAVILGEGGEGKTTLAAELARWLVKTRRFGKAAFVSVEDETAQSAGGVLMRLGDQLVVDFPARSRGDLGEALQLVERALRDRPTILVLDNMESLLDDSLAAGVYEPEILRSVLDLVRGLLKIPGTRVVFTSRSPLPDPFAMHSVRIGRLAKKEAIAVVGSVIGADPEGVEDDEDVEALVDAVNGHARSLVLLAKDVGASGVRGATQRMHELMSAMASRYPDDRERSLFASVELSLRRLPSGMREKLGRLGVFQGGGHLDIIAMVLGLDRSPSTMQPFAKELIDVGLAEMMPYGHLRLHPALTPALLRELDDDERAKARTAWTSAMVQLTGFLVQQMAKDAQLSAVLTLLELPNLLAALDALSAALAEESAEAEQVVGMATSLEGLLANLGRPRALDRVVRVREEAAKKLGDWSRALFQAESARIDRLLGAGRFGEAVEHARALAGRAAVAGEAAYAGAAYDLAMVLFCLGRALQMSGDVEAALATLRDARGRFSRLAATGHASAKRMVSGCIVETGDCLTALGHLNDAAQAYEEAVKLHEARGDQREVAASKGQLGTVRMFQQRYDDALAAHNEAREIFEKLGEPGTVAVAWHQIGMVHEEVGNLGAAEQAYQQSLSIKSQHGLRHDAATTLNQLGNVYSSMGRLEESVRFYRDAIEIDIELGDLRSEAIDRNNVAVQLIQLARYDEARREIVRAIECKKPFGHAAEPWTTFDILHDLELTVGNPDAAAQARERALDAFRAYRRDGGENLFQSGRLIADVGQAITAGQTEELEARLAQIAKQDGLPDTMKALVPVLQSILAGERDLTPASEPGLHYGDVVELEMLLASL